MQEQVFRENSAAARGGGKQNTRAMCPKMLPRVKILQLRGVLLQQGLQQVHFGYEVRRMGRLDTTRMNSLDFDSDKERYLPTLDGIGREERRCSVELLQLERTKQHKTMQCGRSHHESNEGRTELTLKALKKVTIMPFQVHEVYIIERRRSATENRPRLGNHFPPRNQSKSNELDLQGPWFP